MAEVLTRGNPAKKTGGKKTPAKKKSGGSPRKLGCVNGGMKNMKFFKRNTSALVTVAGAGGTAFAWNTLSGFVSEKLAGDGKDRTAYGVNVGMNLGALVLGSVLTRHVPTLGVGFLLAGAGGVFKNVVGLIKPARKLFRYAPKAQLAAVDAGAMLFGMDGGDELKGLGKLVRPGDMRGMTPGRYYDPATRRSYAWTGQDVVYEEGLGCSGGTHLAGSVGNTLKDRGLAGQSVGDSLKDRGLAGSVGDSLKNRGLASLRKRRNRLLN